MHSSIKNANEAKHSTLTGTSAHETGFSTSGSICNAASTSVDSIGSRRRRPPAITTRTGKPSRPANLILADLLNFVDNATQRQLRVIYSACTPRMEQLRHPSGGICNAATPSGGICTPSGGICYAADSHRLPSTFINSIPNKGGAS